VKLRWYPYYDEHSRGINFNAMIHALRKDAEENDAILFHACAHNPTGLDPTKEQWKEIALLCKQKKLFVIFDSAYQGFASGDLDRDARFGTSSHTLGWSLQFANPSQRTWDSMDSASEHCTLSYLGNRTYHLQPPCIKASSSVGLSFL
jgi:DNA-binding transcriptional MocR family regulator